MSNAVYTIQAKVGYSQVRSDNFLTLYSALNYMQDCAMTQLEYLGGGEEYFKNHGVALFISSMQVDIYEMPIFNQDILIDTWAYSYDKISCYRNYLIRDKDNKIYCIEGSTNGAYHNSNITILNKIFTSDQCKTISDGNTYTCTDGSYNGDTKTNGYTSLHYETSCTIYGANSNTGKLICH